MDGQRGAVTLIDDWQARRQRLATGATPPGQYVALQVQILDYLVDRYRDSAEAAQPARCPARPDMFVNDRAIVVHDHLWEGKVGGAKSRQEAEERVASIVSRMRAHKEDEDRVLKDEAHEHAGKDRVDEEAPPESPQPAGRLRRLLSWKLFGVIIVHPWKTLLRRFAPLNRLDGIAAALEADPVLPPADMEYLYECLADPEHDEPEVVDLLAQCANRSMLTCAALAWRQRVVARRDDQTTRKLRELFFRPDLRHEAVEKIGAMLADRNAAVRLEAIAAFAKIGSLEHVGMLSDLVNLPPQDDEDPRERDALIRAMQSISREGEPD